MMSPSSLSSFKALMLVRKKSLLFRLLFVGVAADDEETQ
jgi:hypothetical protein